MYLCEAIKQKTTKINIMKTLLSKIAITLVISLSILFLIFAGIELTNSHSKFETIICK
jgi:hypothetical protein